MSAAARRHEDSDGDATARAEAWAAELDAAGMDAAEVDAPVEADPHADTDGTEYATRGARAHRSARPQLRIVSPLRPERASRGLFALIVTGMLGIGMIVILLINTSLAQGAFTISELKAEQATLSQQEQALAGDVAAASTPESLEQRARAMGMVPSDNPVFLAVPGGRVLGNPRPAAGPRTSVPRLLTPADATMTEAVDNGAADLPVSPGADYDPAAADAAGMQAKAAADKAAAQAAAASATSQSEQPATAEEAAAQDRARAADAASAVKRPGKDSARGAAAGRGKGAGAAKKGAAASGQWSDSTVLDVTGTVSSGDAGLVAVPVG